MLVFALLHQLIWFSVSIYRFFVIVVRSFCFLTYGTVSVRDEVWYNDCERQILIIFVIKLYSALPPICRADTHMHLITRRSYSELCNRYGYEVRGIGNQE
jgi:hypothetical protein